MATNLSILSWGVPRTEEPGGLYRLKESDTAEKLWTHTHTTDSSLLIFVSSVFLLPLKIISQMVNEG